MAQNVQILRLAVLVSDGGTVPVVSRSDSGL